MQQSDKDVAIEASRRRNAAVRKILRIDGMDSNVRLTILTITDFLNCKSYYRVAWPSVHRLAKRLGVSERSIKRYLKAMRGLGIFEIHRFSPSEASAYLLRRFEIEVTFSRCRKHAPNIYEIVGGHPIWGSNQKLCPDISLSMAERSIGKPE